MENRNTFPFLNLLNNTIDITQVPFSDRGSRLLVFQHPRQNRLYIKLAERLIGLDAGIEAYLNRPPFVNHLCLIDEQGEELEFEVNSSPEALFFSTRIGEFGLVFQDQRILSFGMPSGVVSGLRFMVSPEIINLSESGGEIKSIRNISFSTNGRMIKNEMTPVDGGYLIELMVESCSDCAITLYISPEMDLYHRTLSFSEAYTNALERWHYWFSSVPPVAEPFQQMYAYAWWVMGNNLISPLGQVSYEAMTPSKSSYVGLWLWDCALHAVAFRHIDPNLARNQIRSMLEYQLPDGMIPDSIFDEGIVSEIDHPIRAEVTKPPILAWAALKLHEIEPDFDFLREIYIYLVRWNAWWFSMNDDDVDGLAQYNHPYSSGLDDNPLWDKGMPVESPDLNTYLCIQMQSLSMIAGMIGLTQESEMWLKRSKAIVQRMIHDLWDEENGVFRAYYQDEPIDVITPFNLYPLWSGYLPQDIRQRLLQHLRDPQEFWGEYALPTVARNDPNYDSGTMWRGPVWANVNYFFIEALRRVGEHELACELREKTLQMIMKQEGIYEYYDAETGEPPAKAAHIFGWTAAVFIDLAIQASEELKEGKKAEENERKG